MSSRACRCADDGVVCDDSRQLLILGHSDTGGGVHLVDRRRVFTALALPATYDDVVRELVTQAAPKPRPFASRAAVGDLQGETRELQDGSVCLENASKFDELLDKLLRESL